MLRFGKLRLRGKNYAKLDIEESALFSLDNYKTAKYQSKLLGDCLVETRSQAQDMHGTAKSQILGEALRPLVSPEEIMLQFA
jgi:type IV secretory pathway TraG/TraD family ATPase VirD4